MHVRCGVPLSAPGLLDFAHAGNSEGVPDVQWPTGRRRAFSRRLLMPMTHDELIDSHFTQACLPPHTSWEDPPSRWRTIPPVFLSLSDIIPRVTLRKVLRQLRRITTCIQFAMKGEVAKAIANRPRPLHIRSKDMFTPKARGFGVIDLRPILLGTGPAAQFQPSVWPFAPPTRAVSSRLITHVRRGSIPRWNDGLGFQGGGVIVIHLLGPRIYGLAPHAPCSVHRIIPIRQQTDLARH